MAHPLSTAAERYRRWFEYEKDSHRKVIESLEAVPQELRTAAEFQKAVDLAAHLAAARALWLHRFGFAPRGPDTLFPRGLRLEEASNRLDAIQRQWDSYVARLDDAELARRFEYRSLEGGRYRSAVEDILTTLFGHSSYHRGQIAALVRSLGCEPAQTDFVFWSRESCSMGTD